jgi:predicted HTH domain antitoxin
MGMLSISRELELATHMTAQEIRRELAVQLYAQGKLSMGKARELAEMTVYEFQCLLGSRGIPVNYGVEDFLDDLDTIQRLKLDQ